MRSRSEEGMAFMKFRNPFYKGMLGVVLCFAAASTLWAWSGEDQGVYEKAHQNYRAGRFEDAAQGYEALWKKYPGAGVLAYNLGNAYYRQGKLGKSILAYERALLVLPRNSDIRHNLERAKEGIQYRVRDNRNWYLKAAAYALNYFSETEVTLALLGAYFIFIAVFAAVIFSNPGVPWGWRRKSLLVILAVLTVLWSAKEIQLRWLRDAVVLASEAQVRYGPSDSDKVAFRLGEGLKVYVVDKRRDWSRVLLTNSESGWVLNSQIAEVRG